MAILRQENWLGQQRCDVPHLRSIESASCGDFDMLVGRALAGAQALVVTGFDIANPSAAIGSAAIGLQLNVANSILINLNASESGSMFWQSTGTAPAVLNPSANTKVQGAFTPSAYNYIGLDLTRTADTTTSDLVEFLDPNTNLEDPEIVPLARTLSYTIVISTASFASQPNLVPIAIVYTDSSNNVSTLQDARNIYGRLGIGGDTPNAAFQYAWPQGRAEDTSSNSFQGGDKAIGSQKDWMNATMSRIWEIGGGEYWYSQTADRNVTMVTQGSPLGSNTYIYYTAGALTWTGLTFLFDGASNAGVYYNDITNNTGSPVTIGDGYCMYVVLDRTQNHVRGVNALTMQGPVLLTQIPTGTTGGYADVQVVVWVEGGNAYTRGQLLNVNTTVPPATTTTLGVVELFQTPGSSSSPVVLNLNAYNQLTLTAPPVSASTGYTQLTAIGGAGTAGGANGGTAINATGGAGGIAAGNGGAGVTGNGGTAGATSGDTGGDGVGGAGGASTGTAQGGLGIRGIGGTAGDTGQGGAGGSFLGAGGGATSGQGGQGLYAQGGAGTAAGTSGGPGGQFVGGGPGSGGVGGAGVYASGGAGGGNGAMLLANGQAVSADTNAGVVGVTGTGSGVIGRATTTTGVGVLAAGQGTLNNTTLALQTTGGQTQFDYQTFQIYGAHGGGGSWPTGAGPQFAVTLSATEAAQTGGTLILPSGTGAGAPRVEFAGAGSISWQIKGVPAGARIWGVAVCTNYYGGGSSSFTFNFPTWKSSTAVSALSATFNNAGGSSGNSSGSIAGGVQVTIMPNINAFNAPSNSTEWGAILGTTSYGFSTFNITAAANWDYYWIQVFYYVPGNAPCYG